MLHIIGTVLQELDTSPSAEGLPGAELIERLLSWAQMVALWASLGSLFAGAAMYGLAREGGSYGGANRGKSLALGGAVGAVLAGVAPSAVEMLFKAAAGS